MLTLHPRPRHLAILVGGAALAGCLNRPIDPIEPRNTSVVNAPLYQSAVDKIDIVLAIDNSGSMSDKQQILAAAVSDLVGRLVNPRCVDENGNVAPQPKTVEETCPAGTDREFDAIKDIHIGIISSSLGGHGSAACPIVDKLGNPDPTKNDFGHLLTRTDSGTPAQTYGKKAFLAWDPGKKLEPPGISDATALGDALEDMVAGVGQSGCGYEAQLESWYRFLADPMPVDEIATDAGSTTAPPLDHVVLQQRADFLRPDSLLAIVMLTDENDCSVVPGLAQYVFQSGHMWRARQECASDPNDPCCKSCADKNLGECKPDPTCSDPSQPDGIARLDKTEDDANHNLRCFDQKRRFGIDALYPVERYVEALTKKTITMADGKSVPNPIFTDLDPSDNDAAIRDPSLVFFAGIVGVPWQDIARHPDDLANGGFKNFDEMSTKDDKTGATTWDIILGDPASHQAPIDPMMVESVAQRTSGQNPITGDKPQPAGSARDANSINGHEWNISSFGDLQYACVFDLPKKFDCTGPGCDCALTDMETAEQKGNPLCQDPSGAYGTSQWRAKAYPGTRELSVLRGVGPQGIVASVCPAYIGEDLTRDDYGYRPAVGSIIERLKQRLISQCLPRPLTPDAKGQVSCLILEGSKTSDACTCKGVARKPVAEEHKAAIDAALEDPSASSAGWNCFCEIPQLSGKELEACQTDAGKSPTVDGHAVDGWCYVDPLTVPDSNEALVKECRETEKREIRLVGAGKGTPGSTLFITCSGE